MPQNFEIAEFGQLLSTDLDSNTVTVRSVLIIGDSASNATISSSNISFVDSTGTYSSNTSSIAFGNTSTNVVINSTAVYVNGGQLTGTNLFATYTWLNNHTFTTTTPSTNATSGAVEIVGGLGVYGNVYTGGVVGYSNSANVSVVYQIYNETTDSLDTVFG